MTPGRLETVTMMATTIVAVVLLLTSMGYYVCVHDT